ACRGFLDLDLVAASVGDGVAGAEGGADVADQVRVVGVAGVVAQGDRGAVDGERFAGKVGSRGDRVGGERGLGARHGGHGGGGELGGDVTGGGGGDLAHLARARALAEVHRN